MMMCKKHVSVRATTVQCDIISIKDKNADLLCYLDYVNDNNS